MGVSGKEVPVNPRKAECRIGPERGQDRTDVIPLRDGRRFRVPSCDRCWPMMLGPVHGFYYYARLEEDKSSPTGIRSQDFGSDLGLQELVEMNREDAMIQCLVDKIPDLDQPPTGIVGYAAPRNLPPDLQPSQATPDREPAVPMTLADAEQKLIAALKKGMKRGSPTRAALVEHMRDKEIADAEDVAKHVHDDPGPYDDFDTVGNNCRRVTEEAGSLGIPLEYCLRSGKVWKDWSPS